MDLANDIVASLDIPSGYKVEVAGKGFINVTVSNQWILDQLAALYGNTYYDGTVVLDYGGANVAKPMHVGHLRSLVLGDCAEPDCTIPGLPSSPGRSPGRLGLADGHAVR
jgi:arginyl-tRNA synthetase